MLNRNTMARPTEIENPSRVNAYVDVVAKKTLDAIVRRQKLVIGTSASASKLVSDLIMLEGARVGITDEELNGGAPQV